MNIYIEPDRNFTEELKYVWLLFASNSGIDCEFVEGVSRADILIDSSPLSDLPVATGFYNSLAEGKFEFANFFVSDCWVKDAHGRNDYLATAFYMVNGLQEYSATTFDDIGRFRYTDSYQYKFSCVTENRVQDCFDRLLKEQPKLSAYSTSRKKTRIFLSHDIDSVNGALLQDGYHLLRKFKPHLIWSLIFNAVLRRPDWLNMDKIMGIEDEYDVKSTFFWIANKGRINKREVNADYAIQSSSIQSMIQNIEKRGWENGLHKSISPDTLREEMAKVGFRPLANRFHYLKFSIPDLYDRMEESGLRMDASLGFAEAYGFRNSYGLPFYPFDFKKREKYGFLEVPLNLMDGTLQQYMKLPREKTAAGIIDFIEKNKYNCLLSLLWHNTFFTDHKYMGYRDVYIEVLGYLFENKFDCINPSEIIKEYARID